jgi:hypothetical protein
MAICQKPASEVRCSTFKRLRARPGQIGGYRFVGKILNVLVSTAPSLEVGYREAIADP